MVLLVDAIEVAPRILISEKMQKDTLARVKIYGTDPDIFTNLLNDVAAYSPQGCFMQQDYMDSLNNVRYQIMGSKEGHDIRVVNVRIFHC